MHRYDNSTPLLESMAALDELVREGKVRAVGASSFHTAQLAEASALSRAYGIARIDSVQLKYNLVRREIERELLSYCAVEEISVLVFSPMRAGVLGGQLRRGVAAPPGSRLASPHMRQIALGHDEERVFDVIDEVLAVATEVGITPAQVALSWLLQREGLTSIVLGAESIDELEQCLDAANVKLLADARARLTRVSATPIGYPADLYEQLDATFADMRARAAAGAAPPDHRRSNAATRRL